MDMVKIDGKNILLTIDYYTRFLFGTVVEKLGLDDILKVSSEWCEENEPEESIAYNGNEVVNHKLKKFCRENNIAHHTVSVKNHNSNGRFERVMRTLRDSMLKDERKFSMQNLQDVINNYNFILHSGIGKSPREGLENDSDILTQNSIYDK